MNKLPSTPFPLLADAYTVSSPAFASVKAQQASTYNIVNRYSPVHAYPDLAKDSRQVFYGIEHFISAYLTRKIFKKEVKEAKRFMDRANSFGGALPFNEALWMRVVNEYDGYLPITIDSIPDGSVLFPNEPAVNVTAVDGFGEIAAMVESRMLGCLSIGTAAATLCRHWLVRMREQVEQDLNLLGMSYDREKIDSIARWQIHNFGCRASSSEEESILIGTAHLLSFWGTDNFDAAYRAFSLGCPDNTGTSIVALAHRNVLSFDKEDDAWESIIESTKGDNVRIVSCVADSYNYYKAVPRLAELAIKYPDVIVVVRPDSGDAYDVLAYFFKVAIEKGLFKLKNGFAVPTNFRFIYGDSVKPKVQFDVMWKLRQEHSMLPTQWGIWGVGGYIRNSSLRDSLSSSYKLCEFGNSNWVVKLSESLTKVSIPGRNSIYVDKDLNRFVADSSAQIPKTAVSITRNYFKCGFPTFNYSWPTNSLNEFDLYESFVRNNPNYGLNKESLSKEIINYQNKIFNQHRDVETVV